MSALWIVLALVLVAAAVIAAVLVVRKRNADKAAKAAAEGKPDVAFEVRKIFDKGGAALRAKVPDQAAREEMPRYLLIGERSSGKTAFLGGSKLSVQLDGRDPQPGDASAVNLWMLGRALVADLSGRLLFDENGAAAPDAGYRAVLDGLRRLRPERPVDGILIAVPMSEIMPGTQVRGADRKRKGGILRNAVAVAQQALGMNVPVYVVVTQCDRLSGFRSLAEEVPAAERDDILGWSSPYPAFTEGSDDWVDEALKATHDALVRHQARRFATFPAVRSPDDFFLFPSEVLSLGEGLRGYAEPIFLEGAGQETVTLRGLYFCGADAGGVPEPPPPPDENAPPEKPGAKDVPPKEYAVAFSRQLFERKVFAEKNLGRPAELAVKRRSRVVLALQIAACCLGGAFIAALWIDGTRVERRTSAMLPLLRDVESELQKEKGDAPVAALEEQKERAVVFIRGLERLESGKLRSPLNPASWWSRLDARIENGLREGEEHVLVDAFRAGLEQKVETLLLPAERPPAADPTLALVLDKTAEFARLDTWLRDLSTFEANVARYDVLLEVNNKDGSADVRAQSVADLAEYVLGYKTSPAISVDYWRNVLTRGARRQRFEVVPYEPRALEKATYLFTTLHQRLLDVYSDAALREHVAALLQELDDLEKKGAEYAADDLWALRDAIANVELDLAAPALAWIPGSMLPPNPGIGRLLDVVQKSRLLGPEVEATLRSQGDQKLVSLKDYLSNASAPISGPFLERKDGAVQMRLAPFFHALKPPIDTLRQQSFMTLKEKEELTSELNDSRVSWDVDVLKEAERLPKEYEALAQIPSASLKSFEPRVRDTISDLTARQLKTNTLGAVARAARDAAPLPSTESRLLDTVRADANNFSQASVPLRSTIAAFGHLHIDDARDRLQDLVRAQGGRLLQLAASILEREKLYEVRDGTFAWWDGEATPAFKAFDVTDAARLSEYVVAQRSRADTLDKELAEPLLSVMESPEVSADAASAPAMSFWQRVVTPLKDYENKKAGNSVSGLETFLLVDLPLITLENCISQLDKQDGGASSGDFFTDRRRRIRSLLRDQCAALSAEDMRAKYGSLRRSFNRELSGRFPFVKVEPGIRVEDAPPELTRRFLESAGEFRARYRYLLNKRGDAQASEAVRFLDKLEAARAFMMPMWAQADSADDGIFDVKVEFRVNPGLEVGGNRIAEWAMRLADERLVRDGTQVEASWHVNDPVRVDLRWAKSSLDVPLPAQGPGVAVNDRTVTFEERGPWALLRMIAFHQTSSKEGSGKGDSASHVLGFVVSSSPDPTGGFVERVGAETTTVRVFLRVSVTGVEKDKLLRYPEFPAVAPNL